MVILIENMNEYLYTIGENTFMAESMKEKIALFI